MPATLENAPTVVAHRPGKEVPPAGSAGSGRSAAALESVNRRRRNLWWIGPVLVVLAVLVAWLLIARMPFDGDGEELETVESPAVVPSRTATAATATIVDVDPSGAPLTTTEFGLDTRPLLPPNVSTGTPQVPGQRIVLPEQAAPPVSSIQPPSRSVPASPPPAARRVEPPPRAASREPERPVTRDPEPAPRPTAPVPAEVPDPEPEEEEPEWEPPQPVPARRIGEATAAANARAYIRDNDLFGDVRGTCLQVRGNGYSNGAYRFSVWDGCVDGGGSRRLAVLRVDAADGRTTRLR